jgi:acyl carrier protein
MNQCEAEAQVREFLSREIMFSGDDFPYEDDTSLLEAGIIDSMGVLEVVMFVQSTFGISVGPLEVTRDNFDSVSKIARYVRKKSVEYSECINERAGIPGD